MANDKIQAIILAAGKSTRFNTGNSKLTEPICGKEMIVHITRIFEQLQVPTTLVVGYKKEQVQEAIKKNHPKTSFTFVEQHEQRGSGHALACSRPFWQQDHILVLNGDIPLITSQLVQNLIDTHLKERAALSFIVARDVDASIHGYGHVIQENNRIKIVEDRHMNREQLEMSDLNAGIYLFDKSFLLQYIDNLPRHEVSGEYYLTTLIEVASDSGLPICTVDAPFDQVRGVNTFKELWVAEHLKRSQLIEHFMNNGVRFSTPHSVHLDEDIRIAPGAIIGAHAQLFGKTTIGAHTEIGAFTVLQDAIIGNHTTIRAHSIIKESVIGNNCLVDSFTYVHEHAEIQDQCCIDSFNDIKNQKMARTPTYEPHDTKRNKTFVAAFKAAVDKSFAETT